MAFHASNFGSFADHLTAFVDNRGRVPQAGDKARDFDYQWRFLGGPRALGMRWREFVHAAAEATKEAQAALNQWRDALTHPAPSGAPYPNHNRPTGRGARHEHQPH